MNKIILPKDIEPLFGLWIIFELKKCSKKYQNKIIKEIQKEYTLKINKNEYTNRHKQMG